MKIAKYILISLIIIVLDQTAKLLVYKHMYVREEINVIGEWFRLHYLLNPGMAFGLALNNEFGKLILTLFRIGAMVGIAWYLVRIIQRGAHTGFIFSMALILGGAIGNVIDSTFYGVFLNNAPPGSPTKWFHGQVIDMLFFPIFDFTWPSWIPFKGGDEFLFFSPVFNIADSSIFIGVVMILLFQRRFFERHEGDITEVVTTITEVSVIETELIIPADENSIPGDEDQQEGEPRDPQSH